MEIKDILDDEVAERARDVVKAVGLTLEQAVFTYVSRLSEGTEPVMNEFLPDGTLRPRTVREQIYRLGEFPKLQ